ncbi:MAG TPA: hypothetical protein VFO16_03150 [Pseudonocardiaceae bacterium]|nr:hypothetical protein [Pseudonocardiaceae bacterium]
MIGAALLGLTLGGGATTAVLLMPASSARQLTQPTTAASSPAVPPRAPEIVRVPDPVAFAPPFTDAIGMSLTVLRPEKIKDGVRFTIALANTSKMPMNVDTGALGPHDARFNEAPVPVTMTPVRKRLMPGEGYTYQGTLKLPTTEPGRVTFSISQTLISGQASGD